MDQQATSPSIIEKASEHNGPVGAFRLRHVDNPEPCFGRALTRKRQRIYVRQDTCVDSGSDIHTDHHRCLRPGGRRPNWQLLLGGKSPGIVAVPTRTAVEAHHLVRPPDCRDSMAVGLATGWGSCTWLQRADRCTESEVALTSRGTGLQLAPGTTKHRQMPVPLEHSEQAIKKLKSSSKIGNSVNS
jgi:hypothetical protein